MVIHLQKTGAEGLTKTCKVKLTLSLYPRPERIDNGWIFEGEYYADNEQLQSHLFHNVYGEIGSPFGSVYEDGGDRFTLHNTDLVVELVDVKIELVNQEWVWIAFFEAVNNA